MPTPTVKQLAQVPHGRTLAGMAGTPLEDVALAVPQQIPGLAYWLDASQIAGVADGAALAAWPDASGQVLAATPTAGAGSPTFRRSGLGGKPAVDFNPSWSAMATPSIFGGGFDRSFSLFLVEQTTNTSGTQTAITNAAGTLLLQKQLAVYHAVVPPMNGVDRGYTQDKRIHILSYDGTTCTYSINGGEIPVSSSVAMGFAGGLLVGGATAATFHYLGTVAELAVWQHALNSPERQQLLAYAKAKYAFQQTKQIIIDGDSIAVGYFASTAAGQWCYVTTNALGQTTWAVPNVAIVGRQIAQMLSPALTMVDPLYNPALAKNIVICAAGTNDLSNSASTTTLINNITAYCQARRAAGFKVVVCTILPRSDTGLVASFETSRQTVNNSIIANWSTFADALADYGSDATIGVAGASNNATYYNADKLHPISAGHAIIAPYVTTAVNSL